MATNSTNILTQYEEMKKKHPDAILLFRVGDFYESFKEDAQAVSEICGVTLTRRANDTDEKIYLAGFPHHALDNYLPKIVKAGKRVAICEQLEDPKLTTKVVKHEYVSTDSETPSPKKLPKIKESKIYGVNEYDFDSLKPENLVAAFKVTIPKEFKTSGKLTDSKSYHELCQYVFVLPNNGHLLSTDTRILQKGDVICEGFWEDDNKFAAYALNSKSISKYAGHTIKVVAYRQDGETITIAVSDTEIETISVCVISDNFECPDYERITPEDNTGERIVISKSELKELQTWLKQNIGRLNNKNGRVVEIHTTPNVDTIQLRILEEDAQEWKDICEARQFQLAEKPGYVNMRYAAPLFYLSIECDFNGVFYVRDMCKPATFKGEMRETILMSMQFENMYCSDMNNKPECVKE